MPGKTNVVKVAFVGDGSSLDRTLKSTEAQAGKTGTGFSKLAGLGGKVFKALSGGALALGVVAVKAGADEQKANAKLQISLGNTNQSWGKNKKAIEDADKAGENYGYTSADTNTALAQLETSTGSTTKSIKLLAIAQNLAAAKGVPLAAAALAVTKASQGQLKPLKQLGIDLPVAAGGALKVAKANDALTAAQTKAKDVAELIHTGQLKGKAATSAYEKALAGVQTAQANLNKVQATGGTIIGALSAKLKGQASAAANTFGGKMAKLRATGEDLAAKIGLKLIPVIETLATDVSKTVDWFQKHQTAAKALGVAIGALTAVLVGAYAIQKTVGVATQVAGAAQKAWTAATKLAAAGQWLWNAALDANPIGIIVIGIAALVAGVILAYKHFAVFRQGVADLWGAIKTAFSWIRNNWPLLLAILTGPIGLAVLFITKHWSAITSGAASCVSAVKNFFLGIPGFIVGLASKFLHAGLSVGSSLLHGILGGIDAATDAVGGFISSIAGSMKNLINKFIIDPIRNVEVKWGGFHGIGAFDIHPFGFVPRLHSGGVFNSGQGEGLALLSDGEVVFTPQQMAALGGNGGNTYLNVMSMTQRDVMSLVRRHNKQNGLS